MASRSETYLLHQMAIMALHRNAGDELRDLLAAYSLTREETPIPPCIANTFIALACPLWPEQIARDDPDTYDEADRAAAASTLIQLLTHCRSEPVASSVIKAIVSVKTQVPHSMGLPCVSCWSPRLSLQLTLDKLRGPVADVAAAISAADEQFCIRHGAAGARTAELEQLAGCEHAGLLAEAEHQRYTQLLQQLRSIREQPPHRQAAAALGMLDIYMPEAAEINSIAQAICDELGQSSSPLGAPCLLRSARGVLPSKFAG
jgi:hypothetical protein